MPNPRVDKSETLKLINNKHSKFSSQIILTCDVLFKLYTCDMSFIKRLIIFFINFK